MGYEKIQMGMMKVVEFFMDAGGHMAEVAFKIAQAISEGFAEGLQLTEIFGDVSKRMFGGFTSFFGIRSPSSLMQEAGDSITEGFVGGTEGMDAALVGNTEKATALLAEVDKVNTSLNGLDAIEAESTVSKVAAGLAGDGSVMVQHEGLNIQVNFKVNIDSKDLAAALGDDAEGGPFFVINTSRGGADAGGAEAAGE